MEQPCPQCSKTFWVTYDGPYYQDVTRLEHVPDEWQQTPLDAIPLCYHVFRRIGACLRWSISPGGELAHYCYRCGCKLPEVRLYGESYVGEWERETGPVQIVRSSARSMEV